MASWDDVLDLLTASEADDGYDCAKDTAEAAMEAFQKDSSTRIDDLTEESDDVAEEIYSTSKYWE